MTTQQTTWTEFDGSDEQIAAIRNSRKTGYVLRTGVGNETDVLHFLVEMDWYKDQFTHYWIIPDDPLRKMKIRQAMTGQPVWIRTLDGSNHGWYYHDTPYTDVNWNIPNAEYSFTSWKD